MARMKFLCDAERCIECNGCVTACKNENEVPWGVNRRRVVTINEGAPGRGRRRDRRHLSPASVQARQRLGSLGLGHRLRQARPAQGRSGGSEVMTTAHRLMLAGAAVLLAVGISACGERDQVTVYKQGKYQGKPDTKPWENDPGVNPYPGSKWDKGDKTSWERALKARNLAQNEYTRVE